VIASRREDEAFFERVRAGYVARAEAAPARIARIDAVGTREQVWERILAVVVARGW
jgi:dTMP kinase